MTLLTTVLAFLVAIGILVTFHELGHYWAARLCDVKILRFSIGFGRPLLIKHAGPDRTEWVIAALPLGGFVKMADERDGSAELQDRARAFNNKNVWQRIFIVIAGPMANFILAAFFYWVLFVTGMPGTRPYVAAPAPATAAAKAGFADFDLITKIDGIEVQTWSDARLLLVEHAARRDVAEIEVVNVAGKVRNVQFGMQELSKDDLEKDFLGKLGLGAYRPAGKAEFGVVQANSPGAAAGIVAGDIATRVAGVAVTQPADLIREISSRPGEALSLSVLRGGEGGQEMTLTVTPARETVEGKTIGRIGVQVKTRVNQETIDMLSTTVRYGVFESFPRAWSKVWEMSAFSLRMMGKMLTGEVSWKNLSGPVSIADYAGQSAQMGWIPYITFLALISISLGVLNLLPIPVLDGGQLMYYMVEIFKGSPVSTRTMEIGQQVGLTLLLTLTAFAFYNDIHRLVAS
jgi:regulator of sigma E protease